MGAACFGSEGEKENGTKGMRVLDLFSGIGGFSLGLESVGMETVAFCEYEEWPQRVLRHHWPDVPIYSDVRELTYEKLVKDGLIGPWYKCDCCDDYMCRLHGVHAYDCDCPTIDEFPRWPYERENKIDIICGGWPCQPFSVAGKQLASADERHLWPEMLRIIREVRPAWFIGENVPGIINLGLDEVCLDLESADYTVQPLVIPACAIGAPHRRDRVFVIAHRKGQRVQGGRASGQQEPQAYGGEGLPVRGGSGNGSGDGPTRPRVGGSLDGISEELARLRQAWLAGTWEDGHERVSTGAKDRVQRLKALGNAVVPQVVQVIGKAIMEYEGE